MKPKQIVSADEASEIAVKAYVFGYPLVLMDVTRQVMTAAPKAGAHKAPVNQFLHIREFPDYTMTDVVSPNADTLYSTKDSFNVFLRLYWPKKEVVDGAWKIPGVERVK